jgi:subtilisin family serine protease
MERKKAFGKISGTIRLWLLVSLIPIIGFSPQGSPSTVNEAGSIPASQGPVEGTSTTLEVLADIQERARPSTDKTKLESSLNQLLEVHRTKGLEAAQAFATTRTVALDEDRVQVVVEGTAKTIGDLREAVEALGGEYQTHYRTLLQALVPIGALETLAELPDVRVVREPLRPVRPTSMQSPSATSEGVAASNASAWHSAGYDGTGIRIAVIDGGFTGYAALLGTELPASVSTYDWTGTGIGGSEHGTACAEVVYDMAPGAAVDLHKINTGVELGNAIDQAVADSVDIISMSGVWISGGPGDGTGYLASIVQYARSNGIAYVVAAGNNAAHTWSGQYNDDPSFPDTHRWPNGSNVNCFGPGTPDSTCYEIAQGYRIRVDLHWDDWSVVDKDYDLILLYWDGDSWEFLDASENRQAGDYAWPVESISVAAPYTTYYGVAVGRFSATRDVCLRLTSPHTGPPLDERVAQRSVMFPGDSPDAITVGAVDVTTYNLEPYSSRGPTLGPGGTCSGGSVKPDIAAYANVSTATYGSASFSGTSAATPHVAGAAALVKEAQPSYTVAQLQNYLENHAIDLGTSGKDNLYGSGRLRLAAPASPPPTLTSITPSEGFNAGHVHITNLAGSGFQQGATIWLTKSGQPNITAKDVSVVSASKITCNFDLTGVAPGDWNVVVTNPDAQHAQLTNGFTVKAFTPTAFVYLPLAFKNARPTSLP